MNFYQQILGETSRSDELWDFEYRKLFGITQWELLNEPLEVYNTNRAIMIAINEKEKNDSKRMEMKNG